MLSAAVKLTGTYIYSVEQQTFLYLIILGEWCPLNYT